MKKGGGGGGSTKEGEEEEEEFTLDIFTSRYPLFHVAFNKKEGKPENFQKRNVQEQLREQFVTLHGW